MDRKLMPLILVVFIFITTTFSYAQISKDKLGIGLDFGGQRVFGDNKAGIGFGIEGLLNYRILNYAHLSLALGFSQLNYEFVTGVSNSTNMINTDVKGNFEIISKGFVRPYLTLGVGLLNVRIANAGIGSFWERTAFGGGGFKFKLYPQFDGIVSADYRFTSGDAFDSQISGKSNDGYLNVRMGMIYNLSPNGSSIPEVIANESVPFIEVSDDPTLYNELQKYSTSSLQETNNMEEYVKLKSRIDAASQSIDTKENEIEKLQNSLIDRKQQLTSLENQAQKQPVVKTVNSSSMSGFSEIYEAALTNYYTRNYSEAISLFTLLLQQYPNHSLAGNCQYWIGQNLFALNSFDEAINAYSKVLGYRNSFKKDDSIFAVGKSYLNLGFGEKAKDSFSLLIREYPKSEYVIYAKDYIRKL